MDLNYKAKQKSRVNLTQLFYTPVTGKPKTGVRH